MQRQRASYAAVASSGAGYAGATTHGTASEAPVRDEHGRELSPAEVEERWRQYYEREQQWKEYYEKTGQSAAPVAGYGQYGGAAQSQGQRGPGQVQGGFDYNTQQSHGQHHYQHAQGYNAGQQQSQYTYQQQSAYGQSREYANQPKGNYYQPYTNNETDYRSQTGSSKGQGRSHEDATGTQAPGESSAKGWPPALKEYVGRALETIPTGKKTEVENKLKDIIQKAGGDGSLWTLDWSKHPLPMQLIQEEKQAQKVKDVQMKFKAHQITGTSVTNEFGADPRSSAQQRESKRRWGDQNSNEATSPVSSKRKKKAKKTMVDVQTFSSRGLDPSDVDTLNKRAARFAADATRTSQNPPAHRHDPYAAGKQERKIKNELQRAHERGQEVDLSKFVVKGTSKHLEKRYLRLTGVPDASTVRPPEVLQKAMAHVKSKWKYSAANKHVAKRSQKKVETPGVTYRWVSEQFKAIRQDLTVQHIKSKLTVKVYEAHARIALKQSDLSEFNQCMTQLQGLYESPELGKSESKAEFAAYNVLYLLYVKLKYNHPSTELSNLLASMEPEIRSSMCVRHALAVRSAIERGMYWQLYNRLYSSSPHLSVYLVDLMIDYVRHGALRIACKTFRPTLALSAVKSEILHIEMDEQPKNTWKQHMLSNDQVVVKGDNMLTKESLPAFLGRFNWPKVGIENVATATSA